MKILLIDEEIYESEVVGSLVARLEKMDDVVLKKITNVDEGKVEAQEQKYDYIILDMMMHYGAGYNYQTTNGGLQTGSLFLKDLRSGKLGDLNKNTQVIIFSNFVDINVKNKLESNFEKVIYIFKPQKKEVVNFILGELHEQ